MIGRSLSRTNALVTVAIPLFEHEAFIAEAIRSVVRQTYRPLELVIVDDGSSDRSAEVVTEMLDEARSVLERVEFFRQRNRGLPRTLNRALALSRGDYLAVVASDDVSLPHKIQTLATDPRWTEPSTAVVFGDASFIDANGSQVGVSDRGITDVVAPEAETSELRYHLLGRPSPMPEPLGSYASLLRGPYIPAPAALVRAAHLREIGGYETGIVLEGHPMWLKLARRFRLSHVDQTVAHKRVHSGSMSITRRREIFKDLFVVLTRERRYTSPDTEPLRRSSVDATIDAIVDSGYRRDLVKALRRHPTYAYSDLVRWHHRRLTQ